MPNYQGRRKGTRRIVIWASGRSQEWIIEGTKADGDKFEARKRLELKPQTTDHRGAPRFSELCELYAIHAEQHLKESTWQKVRIYQVATLVEHLAGTKVDTFSTDIIDRYKRERLSEKHRGKPVRATAINNELRVLSAIFSWGRAAGYQIPDLKWKKLAVRGADRVKFWTRPELERIFTATRELYPELLPMFIFLANTGCRKGEALAAEWSWIDFEANLIRIEASEYWQPKSGKSRDVPLSDGVRAVLSGPRKHQTVVFPNHYGQRFLGFPKDSFWAILKRAGVHGHPHMFRHTYASNFLAAVPDMKLLAEILGHSTTRVTEIYAHLLPGRLDRAKNAVVILPQTMAMTMARPKKAREKP